MAEETTQTNAEDDMPTVSSEVEGEPVSQSDMEAQLPAMSGELPAEFTAGMPVGLQIFFNSQVYNRCRQLAILMARPEGVCPAHLKGKPAACFAVVNIALTAKMSPFWVALGTYQTPAGSLGFHGDLIQAIMEQSGEFTGAFRKEYFGPWDKIQGKFNMKQGGKGGEYAVAAWDKADEEGCGVEISATLASTGEVITQRLELKQAGTRFSTLWATDPKTQLGYLTIRRFAKSQRPSALMGLPVLGEEDRAEPRAPIEINPEDRPAPRETKQATNGAGETVVDPEPEKKEPEKKEAKKPSLDEQIDQAKTIDAEEKKTEGARPKFTYKDQTMVAGSIKKHALTDIAGAKELSDLAEIQEPLKELVKQLDEGERLDVAAEIKDAFAAKQEELSAPETESQDPEQDDFGNFGE